MGPLWHKRYVDYIAPASKKVRLCRQQARRIIVSEPLKMLSDLQRFFNLIRGLFEFDFSSLKV